MVMAVVGVVAVAAIAAGASTAMQQKAKADKEFQTIGSQMGLQIGVIADTISQNLNYAQQMEKQQEGARIELTALQRSRIAAHGEFAAAQADRGVVGSTAMQQYMEMEQEAMFTKGNIISDSEKAVESTAFEALTGLKDAQRRMNDSQNVINDTSAGQTSLGMQAAAIGVSAIAAGASAYGSASRGSKLGGAKPRAKGSYAFSRSGR